VYARRVPRESPPIHAARKKIALGIMCDGAVTEPKTMRRTNAAGTEARSERRRSTCAATL
jgi:hypothetical protein